MIKLISIIFILVSTGCTTGEKFGRVRYGMSKQQVDSILGEPDVSNQQEFRYLDRMVSGWGMDRADYFVIFNSSGEVVSAERKNFWRNPARAIKWQPYVPPPAPLRIQCDSSQMGGTIYTDCTSR